MLDKGVIQAHHHLIGKGAHIRVVQLQIWDDFVVYHPADKADAQRAGHIVQADVAAH